MRTRSLFPLMAIAMFNDALAANYTDVLADALWQIGNEFGSALADGPTVANDFVKYFARCYRRARADLKLPSPRAGC
jgi:hypothetical protein